MKKDGQRSVPKKQGTKPKRAKKAPGRPPLAGKPTYLRLDAETLRRVEARQKALQAQNKVSHVGQGDVLRALVRDGLDLAERKPHELPPPCVDDWGRFLGARARVLLWMQADGKSDAYIAEACSMDAAQVRSVIDAVTRTKQALA